MSCFKAPKYRGRTQFFHQSEKKCHSNSPTKANMQLLKWNSSVYITEEKMSHLFLLSRIVPAVSLAIIVPKVKASLGYVFY